MNPELIPDNILLYLIGAVLLIIIITKFFDRT